MRKRSVDHAMHEVMSGRRTAGGKRRVRLASTAARAKLKGPGFGAFRGRRDPYRVWEAGVAEDWVWKWAMNQMLINVATRKFARSVRLREGDVPAAAGAGLSKSAASRRFVALSAARGRRVWM